MIVRTIVAIFVLSAVVAGPVSGQSGTSVRVTASADPVEAAVGETVVFRVEVEGAPATVIQIPSRPPTVNLEPRRRAPRTERSRSTEGGELRRTVTFSWRFQPQETGTARIRAATIVVRGEEYTTEDIRVRVTPPPQRPSTPTLTHPKDASAPTLDERDLFIRATATADRAYQNEQVVVEYRLFYRPGVRLRHSRLADSWNAPGFWREELNVASRPTPQPQRVDGQRYETVVLKRVALFPTRPGTLNVDPLRIETEAQGTMRMRKGGPALRGRFESVRLASQSLSLRVRPLPASAPASFEGAVGQFSMTARVDTPRATVGDPVSLTVQVQGTGNLTTLSPPRLDVPSAIEAYEPTVESDLERNGRQIRGAKTFTYTLTPRSGGHHALAPIEFSYFDPEAGQYRTLRAEGPVLDVSGEAAPRTVGRTGEGLPVGDIAAPMSAEVGHWVRTDRRPLYRQPWTYMALLLPILLAGGGIVYRRRWQTLGSTSSGASDGAPGAVQDRLRDARRHLQNGAESDFYNAVEQTLRAVLAERLGLNGSNATRATLDRHLTRHEVPDDLREALYKLLDRCGEAQYAPGASASPMRSVLDEAQAVLRRLDEHLPAPGKRSMTA